MREQYMTLEPQHRPQRLYSPPLSPVSILLNCRPLLDCPLLSLLDDLLDDLWLLVFNRRPCPIVQVPACIPARRFHCPSASRTDPQGTASCPWPFSSPLSSRLRRSRPRLKAAPPQSSAPFSEKWGKFSKCPDDLFAFGLLLSLVQRKQTIFFCTLGVLLPALFRILSCLVLHPEPDQNCNDDPDKEASSSSANCKKTSATLLLFRAPCRCSRCRCGGRGAVDGRRRSWQ
uniref:Uncharacterized protein n=1 Tax=Meloidogyne incognita TaxID=6306 RepID=A0A914NCV1_MELIC